MSSLYPKNADFEGAAHSPENNVCGRNVKHHHHILRPLKKFPTTTFIWPEQCIYLPCPYLPKASFTHQIYYVSRIDKTKTNWSQGFTAAFPCNVREALKKWLSLYSCFDVVFLSKFDAGMREGGLLKRNNIFVTHNLRIFFTKDLEGLKGLRKHNMYTCA